MNTATTQQNHMVSTAPRLDTAGIAEMLGVTRVHVTDRITKRPDFPKPFINVSRRLRYWRQSEVQAWMQKGTK
ncbi:hypothetical protein N5D77_22855 [Comamonas thiooxydans]|uniref:AlpA family phage regulatory protein n=1 Tax=Comamonas thiooxydans TaxID=363952 RepID=A0AA42TWC8_9BURK|nr:hypothetical protein [Comamonas thiooxydans]MDH1337020.1 hypothetical protein [Comamonas thiooxydans]MDH1743181.1 hypothetical protein [Comamonas thiooxydans]MDH1789421.1 hypothetical protein [Comamonas thiooxydans]